MTTGFGLPKINELAPDFEAKSTHGMIRLSDYTSKGKWVMLFSHPADFTPVCTTEFATFAQNYPEFEARGVQLIGLSIDSVHAHIAWVRDIEKKFTTKVAFPVIADLDQKVSRQFGMVHEACSETATVRAVFFIDPKNMIRAILYYPMSLGRDVNELIRVIDALQVADRNACATPANWKPGQPVIVPPPLTTDAAEKRLTEPGIECLDWYLAKRTLAEAAGK